jgi:S1-C subfamily serine protease
MPRPGPALTLAVAALAALGATTAPATAPATTQATKVIPPLPPAGPVVPAGPNFAQRLYDAVTPSLVAVQYTFTGETQQGDVIVAGMVVDDRGLVMFPLAAVNDELPDEQLRHFKVIVPRQDTDNDELDATFEGRDERSQMAFVRVKPAAPSTQPATAAPRVWTPVRFAQRSPAIGETVYSIGILGRNGGYHSVFTQTVISAYLRGPVKQVQVAGGGLAGFGSPVFDATGTAIGIVGYEPPASILLDDKNPQQELLGSLATDRYFIPTAEFEIGLVDPPSADRPVVLSYTGLPDLTGLKKEEADYLGLTGKPAVQVGDVLADSPAERAGLKRRDVIVTFDGKPLERGDTPEELPMILRHRLAQIPPGTVITLGVLRGGPGQPLTDIRIPLGVRPDPANRAKRFWSDDIGFGVREPVLLDRYARHMKPGDAAGVVVTVLKPEASAQTAGLQPEDLVVQVNGQPTPNLAAFKSAYGDFRTTHAHDAIVMVVKREGREQTIRIEPPQ